MEPRVRKIDIQSLLQTLEELYHKGVDFVDIVLERGEGQDTIGLYYNKSYMDEEYMENFDSSDDEPVQAKINVKLSDEDLNNLM